MENTRHPEQDTLIGLKENKHPELETFEWWISGLMLDVIFFLISRLNIACSPHEFNLQIKDITF